MKLRHIIIVVALVSIPVWFFAASWHAMRKMERGYETEPSVVFPYLDSIFREDLGYDGLEEKWIVSSWANGFREHTQLYQLKLPQGELAELVERFQSRETAEEKTSFDHLLDGDYLGPSRAPVWWNTEQLDGMSHHFHAGYQRDWRLTDSGQVQYLLVQDW